MYKKNFEIEELLGLKEGMALNHLNLGLVYEKRSDLKKAEAMWKKSLALFEAIGAKHRIEKVKGLLEELGKNRNEQ